MLENKHSLDTRIRFEEEGHKYYIDGSSEGVVSVTTFLKDFFEPFDSEKAIEAILNSDQYYTDPSYRYYKMSREDILASWKKTADDGTKLHNIIDLYYRGSLCIEDTQDFSEEFIYFKSFIDSNPSLEIYKTEWNIFIEKYRISGSIDALYKDTENDTFVLIDWKRVNKLETDPVFKKYCNEPISHLLDCKFTQYSLQLNLYRYILKHDYGIIVDKMFLIVLHPSNKNQNYIQLSVPNLELEIETMLDSYSLKDLSPWIPMENLTYNDFTPEQKLAYDSLAKGQNLFLTGPGGCSKSSIIKVFYKNFRYRRNIGITSTTGISAILIGGSTIHSFLGIGLGTASAEKLYEEIKFSRPKKILNRWKTLDTLVIDEVSMMLPELFDKLEFIARSIRCNNKPFGGIQIILTGDFCQLPCIGSPKLCFESEKWKQCIGDNVIYLNKLFRQADPVFQECLNEARLGQLSENSIKVLESRIDANLTNELGIQPTKIYALNRDVSKENESRLNELFKKNPELEFYQYDLEYTIHEKGLKNIEERILKNCTAPKLLEICIGAQVMLIYNLDIELKLVNGSRGVVIGFEGGLPKVRFMSGHEYTIPYVVWKIEENGETLVSITQIPLKVAYASTTHKMQGQTLDLAEIDMANIFEDGMAYVALSRVKDLKGLSIRNFNSSKITANPTVVEYYKSFEK